MPHGHKDAFMLELAIWIIIGFISGSVPWALLIGKALGGKDIRSVGDGNPGAANLWKLDGWAPGMLSVVLEVSKSLVPVYLANRYVGELSGPMSAGGLALLALAPVIGHGWSPFLRFNGGKALAASWGSWIAITGGIAVPAACIFLGFMHGLQRNHAITVTFCLVGFLVLFLPLLMEPYIIFFWVGNLVVIAYKHRFEYSKGFLLRSWVLRLARPLI